MTVEAARARGNPLSRPPVAATGRPGVDLILALDLGASRIRAAAVGPDGALLARTSRDTPVAAGPQACLEACEGELTRVRDRLEPAQQSRLAALVVSAPGPLDPRAGRLLEPPNLGPAFHGLPVAGPLGSALGLPALLERDTNIAALGEHAFGAARGVDDFLYLTVSTGIGGAIFSGGRLLRGPDGLAGELGHLPVEMDGPPCGCGSRGHLEALTSGSGIARAAREAIAAGRAPGLAELAGRTGPQPLDARQVAEAEDAGDPVAAAIMERARRAFAAALVGLVDVFSPRQIVVGGSLARGQGERLLGPARRQVAREAFRTAAARVEIVEAQLGDDVALVGAVPLAALELDLSHAVGTA